MRIARIETFHVAIPLEEKAPGFFAQPRFFEPSWIPGFRQSEMRMNLVRLTTDTGLEGVAAGPAMGTERAGLGPVLGEYLIGLNPLDIGIFNQRIQEMSYLGNRNAWLDGAVWDLIGKIEGKPLYALLGGAGGSVAPYMSTGATHGHDPAEAKRIAAYALERGYKGFKLRVKGLDLQEMVDYVTAARSTAGPEVAIMVDANQGWPVDLIDETPRWGVDFAIEFARALEPLDVKWLEEPLNRGDFRGLARLRASTSTPIAGGEMNASWTDFLAMLDHGSLDVYQPDAVLAGGTYAGGISVIHWLIEEIRRRNALPENAERRVKFCPHTWTTGLGMAVALQLVGSLVPEERSLLEHPVEGAWNPGVWGRYVKGGFPRQDDGSVRIPDAPGLGVEVDWKVIKRFGSRTYDGTATKVAVSTLRKRGLKQASYLRGKKSEQIARSAAVRFEVPKRIF